jgi:hypothetical protein
MALAKGKDHLSRGVGSIKVVLDADIDYSL